MFLIVRPVSIPTRSVVTEKNQIPEILRYNYGKPKKLTHFILF